MILPITRSQDDRCIFCGIYVSPRKKDSEYYTIKDGRKIIAKRRFHKECYLENAKESKEGKNNHE